MVEEDVLEDSTIITNLIIMSSTTESMKSRNEENLGMNIITNKLPQKMDAMDGTMNGELLLLNAVEDIRAKNH